MQANPNEHPAQTLRRDKIIFNARWGDYERTYDCVDCGERTTAIVGMGAEKHSRCNRHALAFIFGSGDGDAAI